MGRLERAFGSNVEVARRWTKWSARSSSLAADRRQRQQGGKRLGDARNSGATQPGNCWCPTQASAAPTCCSRRLTLARFTRQDPEDRQPAHTHLRRDASVRANGNDRPRLGGGHERAVRRRRVRRDPRRRGDRRRGSDPVPLELATLEPRPRAQPPLVVRARISGPPGGPCSRGHAATAVSSPCTVIGKSMRKPPLTVRVSSSAL